MYCSEGVLHPLPPVSLCPDIHLEITSASFPHQLVSKNCTDANYHYLPCLSDGGLRIRAEVKLALGRAAGRDKLQRDGVVSSRAVLQLTLGRPQRERWSWVGGGVRGFS